MFELVKKLEGIINEPHSTTFQDEDHYYITFRNRPGNLILLQEIEGNVVVWGYELDWMSNKEIFKMLIETFHCKIVVPFVDNNNDIEVLRNLGFTEYDFYDEDVDEEQLCYPSFVYDEKA